MSECAWVVHQVFRASDRVRRTRERLDAPNQVFSTHRQGAASIAKTPGVGLIAHATHAIAAGTRNLHDCCPHVARRGISEHGASNHRVLPRPSASRATVCETVRGPPS